MLDLLESKEEFQKIEAPQVNEDDRELPNYWILLKFYAAFQCNCSSDSTQIIHQCDQNFNDSQMYISAVNFPLVFMFSVRRQMSPVSARRVAFVLRDFPIGFIEIISNDFTMCHYVR